MWTIVSFWTVTLCGTSCFNNLCYFNQLWYSSKLVQRRPSTGKSQVRRPSCTISATLLGTYPGHPALTQVKSWAFLIFYFYDRFSVLHHGSWTKTHCGAGHFRPPDHVRTFWNCKGGGRSLLWRFCCEVSAVYICYQRYSQSASLSTGNQIVRMVRKKHIPRSLNVTRYVGQPTECDILSRGSRCQELRV